MPAIGIDLGTTNSCISVVKNGRAEIIINNNGERITPSVIGLWNYREIVIGKSTAKMVYKYPEGVVSGVKYTIGKPFNEEILQKYKSKHIENHENKLKYNLKRGNAREYFSSEELSGMLLMALKKFAEDYLAEEVTKVVITVPTYFDDLQREATVSAGKIAGFKEVKLLNESIAAAVAYGIEHKISHGQNIFVFDFGGGTFDVCILKYNKDTFDVLAIDGDLNLGGDNITTILLNYVLNKFSAKINTNDKRLMLRLQQLCEEAKISLSNQSEAYIDIFEKNEEMYISRTKFNELIIDFLDNLMDIVKRCIKTSNISLENIDDILLVGGSSRIPAIQKRLKEYFNKTPKKNINPDEVVAQGAAIVAANWSKSGFEYLKLKTMIAHSIGVRVHPADMLVVIPKYSQIPINGTHILRPNKEYEKCADLQIYSGEDKSITKNMFLGELHIDNIAICRASNIRQFKIILEINDDGILKVTTIDKANKTDKTTITLDKANLTDAEIKNSFLKINAQTIK